jgi:hypothetical protein
MNFGIINSITKLHLVGISTGGKKSLNFPQQVAELYLFHVLAPILLIHVKNQPMHTFITNTTLLTLCHSDMF